MVGTQASPPFAFTITLARQSSWDAQRALRFMNQILEEFGSLEFEIVADYSSTRWRIIDRHGREPEGIQRSIRAFYPDAEVVVAPVTLESLDYPHFRFVSLYQHANIFVAPMGYVTDTRFPDPLATLVQGMDSLQPGERIVYTLVVTGFSASVYDEAKRLMTASNIHPMSLLSAEGWGSAIAKALTNNTRRPKYRPEDQRVLEEKCSQRLYQAMLLMQFDSPTKERLPLLFDLDTHLVNFASVYNEIIPIDANILEGNQIITDADLDFRSSSYGLFAFMMNDQSNDGRNMRKHTRLILDSRELALLWHLPHQGFTAQKIHWTSGQMSIPNPVAQNREGIHLGNGWVGGRHMPVYMKDKDRENHINIIGKPGSGKSTLLHHMITQDINAGYGVAVIDPHGALIRDILRRSIGRDRVQDVVVIDMADTSHPLPLNPLRGRMGQVQITQILSAIEQLFPSTVNLPRLSRYLQTALKLLNGDLNPTLRDIVRIFTCEPYRRGLLERTANDDVLLTWREYDKLSDDQRRELLDPILSRLSPFYGHDLLYPSICHPDGLDFRALIQAKKIILISLKMDDELVSEQQQNIIGSMLISRLQMSGMTDGSTRFHVYIDEVQRFITTSLDTMLSEARKFGMSLTVAHQFLRQLPPETLEALLGTVGATITFQCSPHDARALAMHFAPQFKAEDLVHLDKYQSAITMQLDGKTQPAFTLFPPNMRDMPGKGAEREQHIRELSRRQWTPKTNEQVMAWLRERYKNGGCPDPSAEDNQQQFVDPA